MPATPPANIRTDRQRWMAVLARAERGAIEACLAEAPALPAHTRLRGPETGLVMLRGRAGGGGAPFNFAEMTVTRCTVRAAGRIGHAYIAGRDGAKAELAARLDAALQESAAAAALHRIVIERLEILQNERRGALAARAAATRVEFFTLATMRA
jgi:alpha-D-ribose 1-methylphosphonate 5-triphosphate synthase subunit PhnG